MFAEQKIIRCNGRRKEERGKGGRKAGGRGCARSAACRRPREKLPISDEYIPDPWKRALKRLKMRNLKGKIGF